MRSSSRPFFDFWRTRATFIDALDPMANFYEANVLTWAALDALAGLWDRCLNPHLSKGRRRMGDFLAQHGGEEFGRVSLPALWAWSELLDPTVAPQICDRLRQLRGRRIPDVREQRQLRMLGDDPLAKEVLADLADVAGKTVKVKKDKRHGRHGGGKTTVKDLVFSARFGEIAYEEMRCAIVHEGRLGAGAHSFELGAQSDSQPTYLSGLFGVPPSIGFSPRYMVKVLRVSIDGFEAEANSEGRDPTPPPRSCIELNVDGDARE
jgi:hypothetical protein